MGKQNLPSVTIMCSDRVDVNQVCSSGATAFDVALISSKFKIAEAIMESDRFDVRTVARPDLVDEEVGYKDISHAAWRSLSSP